MDNSSSNKLDFIIRALEERKTDHRFRKLNPLQPGFEGAKVELNGRQVLNFCSNDYLGLATHPIVIQRSVDFAEKYGAGSTASRLVSGNFAIHEELEQKLAEVFGVEAALIFNTGFQANTTVLATLADRNSLVLADKKMHNSLLQGAILSRADFKRYGHNDYAHLEKLLQQANSKSYNRIWIVTETVFSMDGDRSDLARLIAIAKKYNALLFSDDAHALGVWGEKGLGLNYGKKNIHLSLGTFGKAFGAFGAFVGCSKEMKEYLVNFCPGFIYTTALPPPVIGAIDAALELIPAMDEERKNIRNNIKYLKQKLHEMRFDTGYSNAQIIPVIIGDEQETVSLSNKLVEDGIWAAAIRPPTVEDGASRIRITLTAKHQQEDINTLIRGIENWKSA